MNISDKLSQSRKRGRENKKICGRGKTWKKNIEYTENVISFFSHSLWKKLKNRYMEGVKTMSKIKSNENISPPSHGKKLGWGNQIFISPGKMNINPCLEK